MLVTVRRSPHSLSGPVYVGNNRHVLVGGQRHHCLRRGFNWSAEDPATASARGIRRSSRGPLAAGTPQHSGIELARRGRAEVGLIRADWLLVAALVGLGISLVSAVFTDQDNRNREAKNGQNAWNQPQTICQPAGRS